MILRDDPQIRVFAWRNVHNIIYTCTAY